MTSGVTHKLQVDLRYEIKSLTETFFQLSAKLTQAAKELHDPGIPPSEQLLTDVTEAQKAFAALRTQLLGLARIVETTPLPDPDAVVSLRDLAGVLQSAQESRKKSKVDEAKQQILQKLDRIQHMVHTEKADFTPLIDCQDHAAQLKLAIAAADWANPSPELVEGLLPFMDLLRMVDELEDLDDEACDRLQDSIATAFGRLLAVATARGRIVLHEPAPEPAAVEIAAPAPAPLSPGTAAEASATASEAKEAPPEAAPAKAETSPAPASPAGEAAAPAVALAEAALTELPPPEVQELVRQATELYGLLGHDVQKTILRADHDVDLIIRSNDGKRWLARCRGQAASVSEAEVRNFYGALQQEKAVQGAIITLGVFTPQARQWAKSNLLYLLDKKEFSEYLKRARSRK